MKILKKLAVLFLVALGTVVANPLYFGMTPVTTPNAIFSIVSFIIGLLFISIAANISAVKKYVRFVCPWTGVISLLNSFVLMLAVKKASVFFDMNVVVFLMTFWSLGMLLSSYVFVKRPSAPEPAP